MKKKFIPLLALALVILLIPMAGSLAFFTAGETAHNVITSGNVSIELQELSRSGDGEELKPFADAENVMPGDTVSKIVQVKNNGSGEAWVRIRLVPSVKLENQPEAEIEAELISLDIDRENWEEKEPLCFYYKKVLKPGETTEPLMQSVSFSGEMDNRYRRAAFELEVSAQAVQSRNNGDSALTALGWPAEAVSPGGTDTP